jgi:hypothetical protein
MRSFRYALAPAKAGEHALNTAASPTSGMVASVVPGTTEEAKSCLIASAVMLANEREAELTEIASVARLAPAPRV